MKTFEFDYPWTTNRLWNLPEDEEMMQGQFPILEEQVLTVIGECPHKRTCVQAGGAFGLYPLRLAYFFDNVHTFEPVTKNRRALIANLSRMEQFDPASAGKIIVHDFALYDDNIMINMHYPRPVDRAVSNGAMTAMMDAPAPVEKVPTTRLDLLSLEDVDLLWLDVEGCELRALIGAEDTIRKHKPVVVIEERHLHYQRNYEPNARKWLEARGYRQIGKTHADAIFVTD